MKEAKVFRGYHIIMYTFFAVVVMAAMLMAFIQFRSQLNHEKRHMKKQVQKNITRLNTILNTVHSGLYSLRTEAEFYLNNKKFVKAHALLPYIKTNKKEAFFHLDSLPNRLKRTMGNVSGLGLPDTASIAYQSALNTVLHLNPLLHSVLKHTPGVVLTYASFDERQFSNIHPFMPSTVFRASKKMYQNNYQIYLDGRPENNPERNIKWSKAYIDAAGNGLMVSAYIPIYSPARYEGVCGVDFTLDSLNQLISHAQRKWGELFLINGKNQLLAHPRLISSAQKRVLPVTAAFPKKLHKSVQKQQVFGKEKELVQYGGYFVYYENIPHTSWKLVYTVNVWQIYRYIFWDIGIVAGLVLLIVFLLLFVSNRYVQKRFITPAALLVQHIENERDNMPAQPQSVPSQWQPWFVLISRIFESNRQMIGELQDNNEFLEQKVQKRTKEIIAQNEELLQKQEEIMSQQDHITNQNVDLKTKDEQIQQSLRAALTIQRAILPSQDQFTQAFAEHFLIYRPKDVVSGDFYWICQRPQKTILVVADCTGHGVPGAFMTMITNALLDRITRISGIDNPAQILTCLHTEIQKLLRQKETGNDNGLEGSIITLEKKGDDSHKIVFAAAKNNLYYITPASHELSMLKGDRKFIGGSKVAQELSFTNHELTLPKGALLYMGSDGLADQNAKNRKKFSKERIQRFLLANQMLPMATQKTSLEKALNEHMADTEQRDDILVIGMKL